MVSYPGGGPRSWGSEFDRIQRGGLATSTEARLQELLGWGGSTSFLDAGDLTLAADTGIHPVGQVVGLSAGVLRQGYVHTTRPGQGRMRIGVARWRERSGPVYSWSTLRHRALRRLARQAQMLGANAVIEISVARESEDGAEGVVAQIQFSGTAARIDGWRRRPAAPVLTLASAAELWAMSRSGVEPAGIAGGFASIQTLPSKATMVAVLGRRRRTPNVELADLTEGVYEARRLALYRLLQEAKALEADGLVGVTLELDQGQPGRARTVGFSTTIHVIASAVRRTSRDRSGMSVSPVVSMSGPPNG